MAAEPDAATLLLVTGSTGRVGRALRAVWGKGDVPGRSIVWQGRKLGQQVDIAWNIGNEPAPDLPAGVIVIHLAGLTRGTVAQLAENRLVTEAVCRAALAHKARHVFVMSSAAVYRPSAYLIREGESPDPPTDYGRSKHAAERVAEAVLQDPDAPGLTILRLANLAGADALLGSCRPGQTVVLDPIAGQAGGPERSYIGPRALADVLAQLMNMVAQGQALPRILNVAQPPAMAMADLLQARGQPWQFGPPRPAAVARVAVATDRLAALVPLPAATPASLIADLDSLPGRWP